MEKANEEGVPLDPGIQMRLDSELLHELVRPVRGNLVQSVDFASSRVLGSWDVSAHDIYLSRQLMRTHPVIVLFPNHKDRDDPAKRIVRSCDFYRRNAFNRELNRRLRDSLDRTDEAQEIRVVVCYGKHAFLCEGLKGTVYVLWASHVHSITQGGVPVPRANQPFIVNMDGKALLTGLFALPAEVTNDAQLLRMPIIETSPIIRYDLSDPPFVCETRPERPPPRSLPTMSHRQVVALMTDATRRHNHATRLYHADMTTDNEDCVLEQTEDALQVADMVAHFAANPEQTPPVQMSGDEIDDGLDPFEERGS